jgi:CubicO group peptidase (beta-lactamase class C family)
MRLRRVAAVVLSVVAAFAATRVGLRAQSNQRPALLAVPPIEHYLEALRQQSGIPGLSAAVVQDGELVWERGFGFQNVESRIRATPDTPYYVAGLSQSLTAVLLLQCMEQKRLSLDDPVRRFGVEFAEQAATLRHVLTHSSTGTPGTTYRLAPERYAELSKVMEWCAPQPYRKSVAHRILERLAMRDSVPGTDLRNADVVPEGLFAEEDLERYARILDRVAVPYRVEGRNRAVRSELPPAEGINGATGLISTVRDLAEFDRALDESWFLLEESRTQAWSARPGGDGTMMPTGLGWFVQQYRGEPVVWQYGLIPDAYSSMILKLPNRHTTIILLANSDGLAVPFNLSEGDVTKSLFATLLLRMFVL